MTRSRPDVAARSPRQRGAAGGSSRRQGVGVIVGQCTSCLVRFAAHVEHRADVRYLLVVHTQLCPGGRRSGEVVWPLSE